MSKFASYIRCFTIVTCSCCIVSPAIGETPSREDFFESRIRPALIQHCLECHAVDKEINGGLSLDSAAGWQRGGDTGAAIEKGKPEASLLIKAIEYKDPLLQMPPDGQLPEQTIADFKSWIREGAIDPRPEVNQLKPSTALPLERALEHWAYRPITDPMIPNLSGGSAIDVLIQRSLNEAKISATLQASRSVLIRRLKFDLLGLPPTPEEISRFESDRSNDAYERLVDSMLASPRYAERMARRWLDVTRYAESLTLRGFVLGNAWRYRDYCIQSFAEDRPFDEMLREQIAGDLMTSKDLEIRQRQVVATTFLLMGNTNLEEQDKQQLEMDVVDEQLDMIGRSILGQTIGCARCHDHKFDPIPTHDYYAMAGVLKSSQVLDHDNVSKWIESPLPASASEEEYFDDISKQVASISKEIDQLRKQLTKETKRSTPMVDVKDLSGVVVDDQQAKKIGDWKMSSNVSVYVGEGYLHDSNEDQGSKTVTFEPESLLPGNYEVRLAYAPGTNRSTRTRVNVFSADGEAHFAIDQKVVPPIDGLWLSLGRYRFEKDGQAFVIVSNENANGTVIADAVQFLLDTMPLEVVSKVKGEAPNPKSTDSNATLTAELKTAELKTAELKKREAAKKKLDAILLERPKAMSLRAVENATDIPIHIRGDVHNLGKVVPRGALQLVSIPRLSNSNERPFDRVALAEWMTAPEHPLVARVLANRLWAWIMGEGIVRTVDNLGTTGELPSHPELLDYLAKRLLDHQWSVRRVIREIVLSEAYQRSSASLEASELADPENRWLWRAHRRRLDAESIRDAILDISGELKFDMHGKSFPASLKSDYNYVHDDVCRSIYIPVLRNAIPDVLEVFDVADPSTVVGKRNRSTIASQALWMMNHPWIQEQSQKTAERLINQSNGKTQPILEQASLRILGRVLSDEEANAIETYLVAQASPSEPSNTTIRVDRLATIVQSLFQSLDFRFPN